MSENGYTQIILVSDENVERLHGKEFLKEFNKFVGTKAVFQQIIIPASETHKNLESLQHILRQFHEFKASRRSSLVITFGGGVVSDVAGLAASLYHRGLPLVHIPTTLIAQADAAIGGKTGIDHLGSKNEIGTFYPPKLVLVDPLYLRTLPERERLAGLAEVYKYALIGNRELWEQLSKQLHRLTRGMNAAYETIIFDSIKEKIRYVEADEFERASGVRELLNFGHTFGHALEVATNFESFCMAKPCYWECALRHGYRKNLGILASEIRARSKPSSHKFP